MRLKSGLPLLGKKIAITRSQEKQTEFSNFLENLGAKVLDLPVLIIGEPDDWLPLDQALMEINEFDWIIFSSVNGVQNVDIRMRRLGLSIRQFAGNLKVAAVGNKTCEMLSEMGLDVDFVPPKFVADSLIKYFPKSEKRLKLLVPRVQSGGRKILFEEFTKLGFDVVEVSAYESRCPSEIPENTLNYFRKSQVDLIAFTSGKTVLHTVTLLSKYFGNDWLNKIKKSKIVSIGPQTSLKCMKYLKKVDKQADPHDLNGLMNACLEIL